MPWRKTISPEEVGYLEEILRQDLVPVEPSPEFVDRTFGHIRAQRELQVPMRTPWAVYQSFWLLASLSGALLVLALVVVWLFLGRRSEEPAPE